MHSSLKTSTRMVSGHNTMANYSDIDHVIIVISGTAWYHESQVLVTKTPSTMVTSISWLHCSNVL
jgi:hypothetical protein